MRTGTGSMTFTQRDSLALFPTLVEVARLTDAHQLNEHIAKSLDSYFAGVRDGGGVASTDSPGATYDWTSAADLHVTDPVLTDLSAAFLALARHWVERNKLTVEDMVVTELWANLAAPGGTTYRHHHRGAYLAGVYYPIVNPLSGDLVLHDPRGSRAQIVPTGLYEPGHSFSLTPTAGTMVIFPAWLDHSVGQNRSREERVSIACNLVPLGFTGSPRAPRRPRVVIDGT